MTVNAPSSSGANQNPGGSTEENAPAENLQQAPQTVSYDSYAKLLKEKKALQEQKALLDKERKTQTEADLRQKEEYKKLLELREQELNQVKQESDSLKATFQTGRKFSAFLKSIGGEVDERYYPLIDVDKIATNPETGEPDPVSVVNAAKEFESKYRDVIKKPTGRQLPNGAAGGSAGALSYEDWLKLPIKEMKARYKDVSKN